MRTAEASNEGCNHIPPIFVSAVDPNQPTETAVVLELSDALTLDSGGAFRRFLEMAQRLCNAGSAGLSLLRTNQLGMPVMRWEVVSGRLAAHQGMEAPRDASPCGECLGTSVPMILTAPQRTYAHLQVVLPPITEELTIPLYDVAEVAFGTLWLAHHDATSHFGEADVRIAARLAALLVRTMSFCTSEAPHQSALKLLESYLLEMTATACDLAEERGRREQAEASQTKISQTLAFQEVQIKDAHHRIKNTIQLAASFLQLQANTAGSAQVSAALQEGYGRLHVLAEVHELLYKGERSEVSMPLLLQAMATALEGPVGGAARVAVRAACMPIVLAADDAIPLALLANEAITKGELCVTAIRSTIKLWIGGPKLAASIIAGDSHDADVNRPRSRAPTHGGRSESQLGAVARRLSGGAVAGSNGTLRNAH